MTQKRNLTTWHCIVSTIADRNRQAVDELNRLGIKPILRESIDRNYSIATLNDKFTVVVNPKEFPFESASNMYYQGGTYSMITCQLLYRYKSVLEVRTNIHFPHIDYSVLKCPLKVRRMVADWLSRFYLQQVLEEHPYNNKEERHALSKVVTRVDNIMEVLRTKIINREALSSH